MDQGEQSEMRRHKRKGPVPDCHPTRAKVQQRSKGSTPLPQVNQFLPIRLRKPALPAFDSSQLAWYDAMRHVLDVAVLSADRKAAVSAVDFLTNLVRQVASRKRCA